MKKVVDKTINEFIDNIVVNNGFIDNIYQQIYK